MGSVEKAIWKNPHEVWVTNLFAVLLSFEISDNWKPALKIVNTFRGNTCRILPNPPLINLNSMIGLVKSIGLAEVDSVLVGDAYEKRTTFALFMENGSPEMSLFKVTEEVVRNVGIKPPPGGYMSPRKLSPVPTNQKQDSGTNVWSNVAGINDKEDKFQVDLDVCNFDTNDLKVKSVGNRLIIEGKQIERQPNSRAYVAREFNLNYILPQDVAVKEMKSSLSEKGLLTIEAPKVPSPKTSPRKGDL